jgi:hypothetical protein
MSKITKIQEGSRYRKNYCPKNQVFLQGRPCYPLHTSSVDAKQASEHVIQFGLSVVFKRRKTATKPAEFSSRNTTTLLYVEITDI